MAGQKQWNKTKPIVVAKIEFHGNRLHVRVVLDVSKVPSLLHHRQSILGCDSWEADTPR